MPKNGYMLNPSCEINNYSFRHPSIDGWCRERPHRLWARDGWPRRAMHQICASKVWAVSFVFHRFWRRCWYMVHLCISFCLYFFMLMPRERQYIFGPWRTHNYQEPCAHPKWERQGLGESPAYYWAPATMGLKQIIGWVDRHQPPWLLKETTSARSLPSCSFLIVLGFWMLS